MTPLKFANKIRSYTRQSSTTLTDADILLLVNPIKDDLAEMISQRDMKGNYFIIPATEALVAGQREYAWADDQLDHMFSIEFAFTNVLDSFSGIQYIKALPDNFNKWGVARTESNIQSRYSNSRGRVGYEIQRRAIYLLSGAIDATTLGASTITSGVRLRYRAYPSDLSALTDDTTDISVDPTTTTFGFPRQFHELWARAASIEWKGAHPGAVPLSPIELRYEQDLELKLQGIEENDLGGETIGTIPQDDGSDL